MFVVLLLLENLSVAINSLNASAALIYKPVN